MVNAAKQARQVGVKRFFSCNMEEVIIKKDLFGVKQQTCDKTRKE